MESIIHSYRRLIDVKSLTSVQLVKGKESNCELFQFFNFKVMRICSFVCCNGVCKSGLSSTKTKFKWGISTRHKGILCGSFLIEFLQFPLCSLLYKCPNWTDMERLTESVYLLLNWKFRSPVHHEQIFWENSDNKWMKVPSIISIVTKYLTL